MKSNTPRIESSNKLPVREDANQQPSTSAQVLLQDGGSSSAQPPATATQTTTPKQGHQLVLEKAKSGQ